MSSLTQTLKLLESKLEDLQQHTIFCYNNYDYHHKNNECEIVENLQKILKESLEDGKEFLNHMKDVRSSITLGRAKCSDLDELLLEVGINPESSSSSTAANNATTGDCPTGSLSFIEGEKYDELEANKENV